MLGFVPKEEEPLDRAPLEYRGEEMNATEERDANRAGELRGKWKRSREVYGEIERRIAEDIRDQRRAQPALVGPCIAQLRGPSHVSQSLSPASPSPGMM